MSLFAYWVSNFIVDQIKTGITILIIFVASRGFGVDYVGFNYFLGLYSLVIIPFTYMMSLCF